MPRRNFFLTFAAVLAALLFVGLLVRVLLLRYERGDVYPAYSTLRADPLGARAYYEALGSLPGYATERGFTALSRELRQKPGSLFYLGIEADEFLLFSEDEVAALDEFVKNGGRVVVTFSPQEPGSEEAAEIKKKWETPTAKKGKTTPPPPDNGPPPKTQQEKQERDDWRKEQQDNPDASPGKYRPSLAALWGFGWKVQRAAPATPRDADAPEEEKPEVLAQRVSGVGPASGLEPSLPWKSAAYFTRLEPEWQILYDAKNKPVLIQRSWGKGSIVIATDSYLISNEALRNDRRPALLGFLAGPGGRLLFDETHLGTQEQEGVMVLVKKFRLEGYLCGAIFVVLLFVWRNSSPLVPPHPSGSQVLPGGAVAGRDSRNGLVNLLRRNIPPADILQASLGEWKRGVTPGRAHLQAKLAEMEGVLAASPSAKPDQIVEVYHRLRHINQPGRPHENYGTKS